MGRPNSWKPGDIGFIFSNEVGGVTFKKPVKVQVVSILAGDLHPVKVKSLSDGSVYYCTEKELQTRAAKAERRPASLVVTDDIRKEAAEMAEKRMAEIKNAGKPTFAEVREKFYALAKVGTEHKESPAMDLVLTLAEKALFNEIKDGVVWGEQS